MRTFDKELMICGQPCDVCPIEVLRQEAGADAAKTAIIAVDEAVILHAHELKPNTPPDTLLTWVEDGHGMQHGAYPEEGDPNIAVATVALGVIAQGRCSQYLFNSDF